MLEAQLEAANTRIDIIEDEKIAMAEQIETLTGHCQGLQSEINKTEAELAN